MIDSIAELDSAIAEPRRRRAAMTSLFERARASGVAALFTREPEHRAGPPLDFSESPLAVLAENVVLPRHVEYRRALVRILSILKLRDAHYDTTIREYEVGVGGMRVLSPPESAEGLLRGIARLVATRGARHRGER